VTSVILFHPIWFALLLPLSAIVTLIWDWKHRNAWPDRFFWRHWWMFPILAVLNYFLGILIWLLVFLWNILQIIGGILAMFIAFAIIHYAWIKVQMSRMKESI